MIKVKVAVRFDIGADIIDCPEEIISELMEYRDKFIEWLFNKENDHSYWFYKNGKKLGCSYRSGAFVEWLNNFILIDSVRKAMVLESSIYSWDENLLSVFF